MDPVFSDQIVVTVEEGDDGRPVEVVLRGFEAGPAGEIEVVVDDGLTVMVDYAQPHVLTAIVISERRLARLRRTLFELIGEDRAEQVAEIVERGQSRPVRLQAVDPIPTSLPRPMQKSMFFAEIAQSASVITDTDQPALIRMLAWRDVASSLNRGVGEMWMSQLYGRLRQIVNRMIDDDGGEWMSDVRDVASVDYKLAWTALDQVSRLPALRESALGDLRRELDEMLIRPRPRHSEADIPSGGESISESASFTVTIDPRGRLTAVVRGRPSERWARILERSDFSLIAVVPVQRLDAESSRVEAVVPLHLAAADVIVELVDEPFPASSSSITRVIAAVRLGQRAASATALGRGDDADALWVECGRAWAAAGDMTRARKAEALARGTSRSRMGVTRSAFLADRVREALGVDV